MSSLVRFLRRARMAPDSTTHHHRLWRHRPGPPGERRSGVMAAATRGPAEAPAHLPEPGGDPQRIEPRYHLRPAGIDPVDGHLAAARAVALQECDHLHVEEPTVLAELGEVRPQERRPEELEAALRVVETEVERGFHERREDAALQVAEEAALDDVARHEHARRREHVGVVALEHPDEPPRLAGAHGAVGVEE